MTKEQELELQERIVDCFNCWLTFDNEEFEEILREYDISPEDISDLSDKIDDQVDDKASEVEIDIGYEIADLVLGQFIKPMERKMYPEDDPNQLHLFEYEESI